MKFSVFSSKFSERKQRGVFEFPLKTRNSKLKTSSGFTLVEMIVAVGLFAVVMLISVGALLSMVAANRKAQALQSVMNNLNIAVDGMVRSIREGSDYRCNSSSPADPNCPNGGQSFYFTPYCPEEGACSDMWVYFYNSATKRLERSDDGNPANSLPLTAPEVVIESVNFYVIGATRTDETQPKVMIVIKGTAGGTVVSARSTFHLQATAVQRVLDI